MAFISFYTRVAEHRTRFVCLGETPSPRVRCLLALVTYLLTCLQICTLDALACFTLTEAGKASPRPGPQHAQQCKSTQSRLESGHWAAW